MILFKSIIQKIKLQPIFDQFERFKRFTYSIDISTSFLRNGGSAQGLLY